MGRQRWSYEGGERGPFTTKCAKDSKGLEGEGEELRKEETIQPGHQHVDLGHAGVEKPGRDGRAERLAGILLPREPRVNDRLGFLKWTELSIRLGNRSYTGLYMFEE